MTSYFVHETAIVDQPANIGKGTKVWHFSHVMEHATIGARVSIGQNCYVGSRAVIGDGCKLQNNISVYDQVVLEQEVFCGPSMVFTNVFNPRAHVSRKEEYRKTLVKKRASIGANATIVCGVTIGEYAFIGAGAVVTRDVPAYALVHGNPARRHGWMCQCGEKLPAFDDPCATCMACNLRYRQVGDEEICVVE